ncbi:ABZJ_00895 family protein [Thaumasiovibrio subtropicus]|uniref:ABZJ_00895 family protein n=1 Tax=Thaumasiovibrio subtropicus TaxID=1891207 RepID=UPI000B3551C9|nr:ABZJ_00895 family protein [Thaumasiovibrio subtropicus]
MSKLGFFLRFTLWYLALMVAVGFAADTLGLSNASAMNSPLLMGLAFYLFYLYSARHKRLIEKKEKWSLIGLAILGDALVSIVLGGMSLAAQGVPVMYLFVGLAIALPLHFLILIAVEFGTRGALKKRFPEWDKA